jgi:hypothetical protein
MSTDDAESYDLLKEALLKRYNLNEDGFRNKFCFAKAEKGESPDQFVIRLNSYLERWVDLSKTNKSYEGLRDLIIREQFINSCSKDLAEQQNR